MKTSVLVCMLLCTLACGVDAQVVGGPPPVVPVNTSGPPLYSATTISALTVQTPAVPAGPSATGGNSIFYDTSLNASGSGVTGVNPVVQATDNNTATNLYSPINRTWTATYSQGNNDQNISCNNRTDWSVNCGSSNIYLFMATQSGCGSILDLNITTMQVVHPVPLAANKFCGPNAFSSQDKTKMYSLRKTGANNIPIIFLETVTNQNPTTMSESTFADPSTSPNYPVVNVSFIAGFSHDSNDSIFTFTVSNTGVQDTQTWLFVYKVGSGWRFYNTLTGAVTGDWGPTGTVTNTCRYNMHEAFMRQNGALVFISRGGNTITGCAGSLVPKKFYLNPSTLTETSGIMLYPPVTGQQVIMTGHDAVGVAAEVLGYNPPYLLLPDSNLLADATIFSPPAPVVDNHGGWQNSVDDTQYSFFTTTNVNAVWTTPYKNELIGISPSGSPPKRFLHTWSSGPVAGLQFSCQYATANVSPDGKITLFNSDMLFGLGTDNNGQHSCQIFASRND